MCRRKRDNIDGGNMMKNAKFFWLLVGFVLGAVSYFYVMPDGALFTAFWWGLILGATIGFVLIEALKHFVSETEGDVLREEVEESMRHRDE